MAQTSILQDPPREITFKDYFETILKRKNIAITFFLGAVIISGIYNIMKPDIYEASSQILINDPVRPTGGGQTFQGSFYDIKYFKGQVELMKSSSVLNSVVEKLDLTSKYPDILTMDPKTAAGRLGSMTSITAVGESRICSLAVRSPSPNLSAEAANGLVNEYIEKSLVASLLISKDMMKKWFPEENDAAKVEGIFGKVKDLSRDEIIQSLPVVDRDPKIAELKVKRQKLEREIALYTKKYTDKHPKLVNARKELQIVKDETRTTANTIVSDITDSVSGKFRLSNIRVIEYAEVPEGPVNANRMKNFLLVSLMGLFAGCGIALFVDYLDNTVKTQDDVEKHMMLPYLGYVPMVKARLKAEKKPSGQDYVIVNPAEHKSALLEALRNIRTSIVFSAPPDSLKSILVTSALPREGKSTVSMNMAVTFASDGSRTLLVDADMRRPTIHKMLGIKNSVGLSNYLTSKTSLHEVVQDTKFPNLKLMTCGPIPPNPPELFGSYRMKELLEESKKEFDRIVFDGAPIFGISDSVVLGKMLDGVIQIVRFGKVTWDVANKSKQRLQSLGVKITGVIINSVDIKRESYYYKYYDYRYHKYYD